MSAQINVATKCVEVVILNDRFDAVQTLYVDSLTEAMHIVDNRNIHNVEVETLPF
jgi:hypothetical protein